MTEPRGRAVKLFAGAGGSCLGARAAGIEGTGIELDPAICRTRRAAGLETVEGSVCAFGPADFPDATGLIGTPPCQLFSTAGTGEARKMLPEILAAVAAMGRGEKPDTEGWPIGALLVLEPLRWIIEAVNLGRPYEWVVLEQVPPVLPIWQAYGEVLRAGYGVAAANLQAECWGVPQTRKRAIFVARLGKPAKLPTPTHSRYYPRDPKRLDAGVLPWVSMAEALEQDGFVQRSNYGTGGDPGLRGIRGAAEPSSTITSKAGHLVRAMGDVRASHGTVRDGDQPSPTLTSSMDNGNFRWVPRGMLSAGGNNTAGQRERPPAEPSATLTGKGTAYWQVEPLCAECGCSDLVHDEGGFCAGPCGGTCGGRNPEWTSQRPATSVNGDPRIAAPGRHDPERPGSQYGPGTIRVSVREAGILQSFPADFPWQGSKTMQYRQVGNSAPPLLVEAVVRALLED